MILIRHGQSHFNLHYGATRVDPGIVDPGLTDEGRRQVEAAADGLSEHGLTRIVASPYTRTLETAAILAEQLKLAIEVEPLVRERSYFTCDIGTPRSELARLWPEIDFAAIEERWWTDPEESVPALHERCLAFHGQAGELDDWPEVLVVSHWAFIRGLTGTPLENAETLRFDPTGPAPGLPSGEGH